MAVALITLQYRIMGARLFAIWPHGHFGALSLMATNGLVDHPTTGHNPRHNSFVLALDSSRLQLSYQVCMGLQCLGHYHQACGVFIQPVNNTGAGHGFKLRTVIEKPVE